MARTTRAKKQAEAPKVNIGTEIFESLRDLEKLKGIPVDYMVERLKQALVNAYRRDREDHRVLPARQRGGEPERRRPDHVPGQDRYGRAGGLGAGNSHRCSPEL